MATCGGAQVALQQRLILRPGNCSLSKTYKGVGHFSIITVGYFWLVISTKDILNYLITNFLENDMSLIYSAEKNL